MCRYAALANLRLPITDSGRMAVSGQSFMATGGQFQLSADTRIRSAHLGSHQPRQGAIPDERDDWHRSASTTTANAPKAKTIEAIRALKRQLSNVIYRSLLADARRLEQ